MMDEKDLILEKTKGGLRVFQHYLGSKVGPNMKFKNPFYDDTRASCNLYYGKKCGRYFLVDFGNSGVRGDCFWFVAQWEHLDYKNEFEEILRTIDHELNLNIFNDTVKNVKPTIHHDKPQTVIQNLPQEHHDIPFSILTNRRFTAVEQKYWQQYGIDEQTLERYHVKSLMKFESQKQDGTPYSIITDGHPFFGYVFGEKQDGIKIYRPGQQMRFLYAGHLPHPYVFGLEQLPAIGRVIYITGGEKDVMSLAAHGFHTISLNSETAKVPEDILPSLLTRFENMVFLYDSDDTGIKESTSRVNELRAEGHDNVFRLQLPLAGTKQEKDISDFFRLGHTSQELDELTEKAIETREQRKQLSR